MAFKESISFKECKKIFKKRYPDGKIELRQHKPYSGDTKAQKYIFFKLSPSEHWQHFGPCYELFVMLYCGVDGSVFWHDRRKNNGQLKDFDLDEFLAKM